MSSGSAVRLYNSLWNNLPVLLSADFRLVTQKIVRLSKVRSDVERCWIHISHTSFIFSFTLATQQTAADGCNLVVARTVRTVALDNGSSVTVAFTFSHVYISTSTTLPVFFLFATWCKEKFHQVNWTMLSSGLCEQEPTIGISLTLKFILLLLSWRDRFTLYLFLCIIVECIDH